MGTGYHGARATTLPCRPTSTGDPRFVTHYGPDVRGCRRPRASENGAGRINRLRNDQSLACMRKALPASRARIGQQVSAPDSPHGPWKAKGLNLWKLLVV